MRKTISQICKVLIFVISLSLCFSCTKDIEYGSSAVVLMVDDGFIDEWSEYIEEFSDLGAKLTFYITNYLTYSEEKKMKLHAIDSLGHEIGFHGTSHVNLLDYLEENTLENYLQEEILAGLDAMLQDGFDIKHFAYPYGRGRSDVDSILLCDYFLSIRKVDATLTGWQTLKGSDNIYYDYPLDQTIIAGAGIDNYYDLKTTEIFKAIDKAQVQEKTILLFCHRISDEEGDWNVSSSRINDILNYCLDNEIKMATLSEAYGLN